MTCPPEWPHLYITTQWEDDRAQCFTSRQVTQETGHLVLPDNPIPEELQLRLRLNFDRNMEIHMEQLTAQLTFLEAASVP